MMFRWFPPGHRGMGQVNNEENPEEPCNIKQLCRFGLGRV